MISPAEVARVARDRRVADRVIEKDYVLSWLLVAIAKSEVARYLALQRLPS
ncbi:MAG: hypothetical protein ACP5JJ_10785 [Anaerolineae bacterium]